MERITGERDLFCQPPVNPGGFDASGRSDDVRLGLACGNYYFAPDANSLPTITLDIAARIIGNDALLADFSAAPLNGIAPLTVTFDNRLLPK